MVAKKVWKLILMAFFYKLIKVMISGYLFFLSTGIFFGFNKPLVFFAFENVESVSYTSILQRTFNLNIMAQPSTGDETQEFELSMIDQADFAGIDTYVKKHGLQDASLAEARRAKKYNVNGGKAGEGGADANAEDTGEGELQRAEREIDDQEDEDEEDYDPGSDSESDGSGSSSDEDEDEDGENENENEDGEGDLVVDELGSEAEDVSEE